MKPLDDKMRSLASELRAVTRKLKELDQESRTDVRFWSNVDIGDEGECWPWLASRNNRFGHGQTNHPGTKYRTALAHRRAYELTKGEIPPGMYVCHACDNPPCCNPAHLWLGTPGDNSRDCWRKGRAVPPPICPIGAHARGMGSAKAKLTDAQVLEIATSDLPNLHFAQLFGVGDGTISNIRRGATWGHLTGIPMTDDPAEKRARIQARQKVEWTDARRAALRKCKGVPVEIDGVQYETMRDARDALGFKTHGPVYKLIAKGRGRYLAR